MKKILIPTDFSVCANYATKYAVKIATKLKCEVEFLHIISTPINWLKIPLEKEKQYPEILERIRIAKNEFASLKSNLKRVEINAVHSLVFNLAAEDITAYIDASEYELIIMGSHGSSGLSEKLIGSNTQKVIRNSSVPVLVVKNNPQERLMTSVFVSDFEDITEEAFHKMTGIANNLEMRIKLLYVNTDSNDTEKTDSKMDGLLKFCNREKKCSKHIINAESIEKGIESFSKNENIDFVCICTHGKSGLKQLFSPSVTERIANHIELPLLSIKL